MVKRKKGHGPGREQVEEERVQEEGLLDEDEEEEEDFVTEEEEEEGKAKGKGKVKGKAKGKGKEKANPAHKPPPKQTDTKGKATLKQFHASVVDLCASKGVTGGRVEEGKVRDAGEVALYKVGKGIDVLALTLTRTSPPTEEHALSDALITLLDRHPHLTLAKVTVPEADAGRVLGSLEAAMPKGRKGQPAHFYVQAQPSDGALLVAGDYTTSHGVVTHHQLESRFDGWDLNGPLSSRHTTDTLCYTADTPGLTTPSRYHAPHPLLITPDPAPLIGHQDKVVPIKDVAMVREVVENADAAKLGKLGHVRLRGFLSPALVSSLADQALKAAPKGRGIFNDYWPTGGRAGDGEARRDWYVSSGAAVTAAAQIAALIGHPVIKCGYIWAAPGSAPQHPHRDVALEVDPPGARFAAFAPVSADIPVDAHVGYFVPHSTEGYPRPWHQAPLDGAIGDVRIINSRTVHWGGGWPKEASAPRCILFVSFGPPEGYDQDRPGPCLLPPWAHAPYPITNWGFNPPPPPPPTPTPTPTPKPPKTRSSVKRCCYCNGAITHGGGACVMCSATTLCTNCYITANAVCPNCVSTSTPVVPSSSSSSSSSRQGEEGEEGKQGEEGEKEGQGEKEGEEEEEGEADEVAEVGAEEVAEVGADEGVKVGAEEGVEVAGEAGGEAGEGESGDVQAGKGMSLPYQLFVGGRGTSMAIVATPPQCCHHPPPPPWGAPSPPSTNGTSPPQRGTLVPSPGRGRWWSPGGPRAWLRSTTGARTGPPRYLPYPLLASTLLFSLPILLLAFTL